MYCIFKSYIRTCKIEDMERSTNRVPTNDCVSDYISDFEEKNGNEEEFGSVRIPFRSSIEELVITKDA